MVNTIEITNTITQTRHFSGFTDADRTDEDAEWHDRCYVLFGLAEAPLKPGWKNGSTDWRW